MKIVMFIVDLSMFFVMCLSFDENDDNKLRRNKIKVVFLDKDLCSLFI